MLLLEIAMESPVKVSTFNHHPPVRFSGNFSENGPIERRNILILERVLIFNYVI